MKNTTQARRGPAVVAVNGALFVAAIYFLAPLAWLAIAATKDNQQLQTTFGLAVGGDLHLVDNIRAVFSAHDGVYINWFANTILYSTVSAIGAALVSTAAGYALAKYAFPGRAAILGGILLAVAVPITVLVLPIFLILSKAQLVNTPWAMILPSMLSPFGVYLMWIYASENVPVELLEAARIDGARETRVLRSVAGPLLMPGFVTVLLFSFVATWNNYFLPLLVFSDDRLYPLAVGLASWNALSGTGASGESFVGYPTVITGALIAVIPLIAAFVLLQRYWQSGLTVGSVKG